MEAYQSSNPTQSSTTPIPTSPSPAHPTVISLSLSPTHTFTKTLVPSIQLVASYGVLGDCHFGTTVQHRSRLHIRPIPPNLRQVHLVPTELFDDVAADGFVVQPGDLGENITTRGIDLLRLGRGAKLRFVGGEREGGEDAGDGLVPTIVVTGLRNPCPQIDRFAKGLKERVLVRDDKGAISERRAGIMATVEVGGPVKKGARIEVEAAQGGWVALECV